VKKILSFSGLRGYSTDSRSLRYKCSDQATSKIAEIVVRGDHSVQFSLCFCVFFPELVAN